MRVEREWEPAIKAMQGNHQRRAGGEEIRAREMSSPHTQRHPNSVYDGVDCGASALAMTGDCRSRALAIAPDDSADCSMMI